MKERLRLEDPDQEWAAEEVLAGVNRRNSRSYRKFVFFHLLHVLAAFG